VSNKKTFVTKPVSPSKWRLTFYFLDILQSRIYTNDGKYLRWLESDLRKRWNVKHVVVMSNGTLPLICLLEMLGRNKKILTTPFTFVATTNAILASGNFPIFVDIDRETLLPSVEAIEEYLNRGEISAVLLTQVFGIVPDYERIQALSKRYNVPVFFDSSHSFGVETKSGSAYGIGHATSASFHSTKIFSTIEGGAVITNDSAIFEYAKAWRNFGITNGEISQQGINAKMHEFSAAFGLAVLPRMKSEMVRRRNLFEKLRKIVSSDSVRVVNSPNASYFPIVFRSEIEMLEIKARLEDVGIFPRRYFYPSLDELSKNLGFADQLCPISRSISSAILCLPMGHNVNSKVLRQIEEVFYEYES
jgi:dTDP-4-amino-4,6-dideoxygalactose transaminase